MMPPRASYISFFYHSRHAGWWFYEWFGCRAGLWTSNFISATASPLLQMGAELDFTPLMTYFCAQPCLAVKGYCQLRMEQ
jgi:hypothetical protein